MKKIFLFVSALFLSATLFAQEETELFVPANASVDHTWSEKGNPEATWNAATGTLTITLQGQASYQWGNQVFLATGITTLDVTKEYQVSFDIVASTADCGGVTFKAFDDTQIAFANQNIAVTDVVQTWTSEWTKPAAAATNGLIVWDFGWDPVQTITISNISIKEREAQTPPEPTSPTEAPAAPTVPADQVKAVYSATYSADCGFGDWGSGTTYAQEDYGKKFTTTSLGYFGLVDFALNCSKMEALHLDVWFTEAGSFRVVPIHGGAEQGVTVTVAEGEVNTWKSVDLPLAEGAFANVTDWSNVYQIKIDNVSNKTFWLNNIYFYTSQAPQEDEDAPENFTAEVVGSSYGSVTIKAYAEDASGEIIFTVKESGAIIATANGVSGVEKIFTVTGLASGTTYSLLVLAADPTGNVADGVSLEATTLATPASPEAPIYAEQDVISIFSDSYSAATSFNVGSWGQSTVSEEVRLADNGKAYFLSNANYLGWELATTIDVTNMKYVRFDVYPLDGAGTAIEFTPIWGGENLLKQEGLVAGAWNTVTFSIEDFPGIVKDNIYQLKWANMPTEMFITNVLFYTDGETALESVKDVKAVQKVMMNGNLYIRKGGKIYNAVGMAL